MQETIKTSPKTLLEDLTKKIYELVLEAKTDYRFKKFVVSILRKNDVLREDAKTKAQVLLSWFQKNIRPYYVPDGFRVENVKSPLLMLAEYQRGDTPYGDCDDFVAFYTAMLESIGIPTTVAYVSYSPHKEAGQSSSVPNHIVALFKDPKTNEIYLADPTSNLPVMNVYDYHTKIAKVVVVVERVLPSGEVVKFA